MKHIKNPHKLAYPVRIMLRDASVASGNRK